MQLIGHRGAAFEYPENTLGGFLTAFGTGIRGFELDLQLTLDGEVVVIHDSNTLRTCGVDKRIQDMTWNEIKTGLNAASNSNVPYEIVPKLSQLLPLFERCTHIELEIKKQDDPAKYRTICLQLNEMMATCDLDKYYITSGHSEPLIVAQLICPIIKRGFVFKNLLDCWSDDVEYFKDIELMVCDYKLTPPDVIGDFKRNEPDMPLAIHGVNSLKAIQQLRHIAVDYVITDNPQKAFRNQR